MRAVRAALALALAGGGTAARAQGLPPLEPARRCQEAPRAAAVEACREALRLGLSAGRARALRQVLAASLVSLGRGGEAVEVYREAVRLRPDDAEARLRLGRGLLLLTGDPAEAAVELQAALRLGLPRAEAYGLLGSALLAMDQRPESVAAFAEAERLDPSFFAVRPAARLAYEAAKGGESWP